MKHISELFTEAAATCERVTGRTLEEWEEAKRAETLDAVQTRRLQIGELYTAKEAIRMHRIYGLPADAFEAVSIGADDPRVTLTDDEWKTREAWNQKKGTIQIVRHGRPESVEVRGYLTHVLRFRLVRLEEEIPDERAAFLDELRRDPELEPLYARPEECWARVDELLTDHGFSPLSEEEKRSGLARQERSRMRLVRHELPPGDRD